VHRRADLQSVHGFRCYNNIHVCKFIALYTAHAYSAEREMSASACMLSLRLVCSGHRRGDTACYRRDTDEPDALKAATDVTAAYTLYHCSKYGYLPFN